MLKCKKSENVKKNEEVLGVGLPVSAPPILCFEGHKIGRRSDDDGRWRNMGLGKS